MNHLTALLFHCKAHGNGGLSHWITKHDNDLINSLEFLYRIFLIDKRENKNIIIAGAFIKTSCHHSDSRFLENAMLGMSYGIELQTLLKQKEISIKPSLIKEHDLSEEEMFRLTAPEILQSQPEPKTSKDIAKVESFSTSVTLNKGIFFALNLKFILSDGSEVLTAWNWESSVDLYQWANEYFKYLKRLELSLDTDSLEATMLNAPQHTPDETETFQGKKVVKEFSTAITVENDFVLKLHFIDEVQPLEICFGPNYAEWLAGYVGNILNEFNKDGKVSIPEGLPN